VAIQKGFDLVGLRKDFFQEGDVSVVKPLASITTLAFKASALGSRCVSSLSKSTVINPRSWDDSLMFSSCNSAIQSVDKKRLNSVA